MANDPLVPVRQACVASLQSDAGLIALVGDRVYGPQPPAQPVWPFVRYGIAISTPRRATGIDGAMVSIVIHGFAKGDGAGATPGGEELAGLIAAAIAQALDGRTLLLADRPEGRISDVAWISSEVMPDAAEAGAWHAVVRFEAMAVFPRA